MPIETRDGDQCCSLSCPFLRRYDINAAECRLFLVVLSWPIGRAPARAGACVERQVMLKNDPPKAPGKSVPTIWERRRSDKSPLKGL